MTFSSAMRKILKITPPCTLILEYNEAGEIVIRANHVNNKKNKKR